jgi:hypothetical protein
MGETIIQKASLIGRVIEDLNYEGLSPQRFVAELKGMSQEPQYKEGGFFVFSNLRPGAYTALLSGQGFQPQEHRVELLSSPLTLGQPGDDELIVVVNSVNGEKILFDEVILNREIRAGAKVIAQGLTSELAQTLEIGKVKEARLKSVTGLNAGALARIVRGDAIRLRFNPYHRIPSEPLRVVGRVTAGAAQGTPLARAQVRITLINDQAIVLTDVGDAKIETVTLNTKKIILGSQADITTLTNEQGDYNFYFGGSDFLTKLTLEAALAGYQPQAKTAVIQAGQRPKIDFQLVRE